MKRNKFIVIGSGRLGSNIATSMSELGEDVIIIDAQDDSFRKLQESFSGYQVVGDATDLTILENSYIKHAKTVVITTDSDNVNIYLAHPVIQFSKTSRTFDQPFSQNKFLTEINETICLEVRNKILKSENRKSN